MASRSARVRLACVLAMLFMPAPSSMHDEARSPRPREHAAPVATTPSPGTDTHHLAIESHSPDRGRLSAIRSR
jgi:hypothetical protein